MNDYTSALCRWLDGGVSPYHAVQLAAETLRAQGFSELELSADFSAATAGGRWFVESGTFLAAFSVEARADAFRIAAAHTDWPCFRVKPRPELSGGCCCRLSVEPYGGAILNTWLDRPLSLAGAVLLRGADALHPVRRLVNWAEPVATIPNLAIHLNREVNKGVATRPNVDMLPVCAVVRDGFEREGFLIRRLAEKLAVEPSEILSFELYVYCAERAQAVGFDGELLSAPRLDNLTSVHACIDGLCRAQGGGVNVAVLYDNEEIGSNTRRGADSATLTVLLEKLALALGLDRQGFLNACLNGMLLSCDAAHALHPNHPEFADAAHAPKLGGGVALKRSPRYSSEAETCAVLAALCAERQIPMQYYMNRADLPGGSTVGSMASALLAMPAADVGVPLLAMHSARELMGAADQEALCRLCEAFFSC